MSIVAGCSTWPVNGSVAGSPVPGSIWPPPLTFPGVEQFTPSLTKSRAQSQADSISRPIGAVCPHIQNCGVWGRKGEDTSLLPQKNVLSRSNPSLEKAKSESVTKMRTGIVTSFSLAMSIGTVPGTELISPHGFKLTLMICDRLFDRLEDG